MSAGKAISVALLAAVTTLSLMVTEASAVLALPTPAWSLQALAGPTNFTPGDESGLDRYEVWATNSGGKETDNSPITITDTLPKGLTVKNIELRTSKQPDSNFGPSACETKTVGEVATVTCVVEEGLAGGNEPAKVGPSEELLVIIQVATPASILPLGADPVDLINVAEVDGGGVEEAVSAESHNLASEEKKAAAGFQEYHAELTGADGRPVSEADSHPFQYTTSFAVNLDPAAEGAALPFVPAGGDLKNIEVALPPGLIANPTAIERCTAQEFNTVHGRSGKKGNFRVNECPESSVVGLVLVQQLEGAPALGNAVPIYNLVPPPGMPAQLGFQAALGVPLYINAGVRNGPEGLTVHAFVPNITQAKRVTAGLFTLWGTPAESDHNSLRGVCLREGGSCPAGIAAKPFFRLPSSCENPLLTTMGFETWAQPSASASASFEEPAPIGCSEPDFSPNIESKPTTNLADSPSGFHFDLHLPQEAHQDPEGLAEADLRDVSVTLPKGLAVNPASADGLAACTPAQIGLESAPGEVPIEFDEEAAHCPNASKVATVEATTPLLDHPIEGSVFLASQEDNPFKSLIALYIALEDPQTGVVIKVASEVRADPVSGQLTTTVKDAPQAPVEDFIFDFFQGTRAPLRTPPACGTYTTTSELTPWTAPEGASATSEDSFQITAGPDGPCPSGALAPKLAAGLANPTAGAYSPFHLRLTRADATAEFAGINATTPKGFAVKLAGVPYCPEAGIAEAAARNHPGQGALELTSPSCPAASQVGTTTAGAGAGPTPFYTSGKFYLAGPYKGAPLSFVAIIPAVAGPFDLGVVVDRIAAHVDPETAQATSVADPLPTILSGIPVDLRDVRLDLDRPNFAVAPTSCEPKSVDATVFAPGGASANVSDRFQLGGCGGLGFKVGLSLKLNGASKRGGHPALRSVVTYPTKGRYANIARASVALPHSEFLDTTHIRTICTRVQFVADTCPAAAIYGKARATSPLLDRAVEGPIYLRSSSHPLPDLVLDLHGQIDAVAVGRVDSIHGGTRVTFDAIPDVPLAKVVLEMQGGKKGLLQNSRNICTTTNRATVKLSAQNGKIDNFRTPLKADCKAKPHKPH